MMTTIERRQFAKRFIEGLDVNFPAFVELQCESQTFVTAALETTNRGTYDSPGWTTRSSRGSDWRST